MNPCQAVRETTAWVVAGAKHVTIDAAAVDKLAQELLDDPATLQQEEWDTSVHYCADAGTPDGGVLTVQYLFVLDSLNFCFWPTPNLEYEHLAQAVKAVVEADAGAISAESLAAMDAPTLEGWFRPTGFELPQLEERVRKVRELGCALLEVAADGGAVGGGGGTFSALDLVRSAGRSAARLVELITRMIPGFRDHAVYGGRQIFLLKRAQILVSNIWGAHGRLTSGEHPCAFSDVEQLTMFADYRVPQLLRPMGVMVYAAPLAALIDAREELAACSEQEVEIRAATVQAVEQLRAALAAKGRDLPAAQVDWMLWQRGEQMKETLPPHHRTLTVFY